MHVLANHMIMSMYNKEAVLPTLRTCGDSSLSGKDIDLPAKKVCKVHSISRLELSDLGASAIVTCRNKTHGLGSMPLSIKRQRLL